MENRFNIPVLLIVSDGGTQEVRYAAYWMAVQARRSGVLIDHRNLKRDGDGALCAMEGIDTMLPRKASKRFMLLATVP
jgi:hypothetical protein